LTSDLPWMGDREFKLSWQSKIDSLDIGKSATIDVPVLTARGIDQSYGQITLHKREGIDLDNIKSMDGLRAIDPRYDLMPEINMKSAGTELADVKQAAQAFEYQGEWRLSLEATRFALQAISTTNIERAYIQATLTRSDQIAIQAAFRMKNSRQRVALKLPVEAEFNSQPLRINGEVVSLERGVDGVYFIPMSSSDPSIATLVEISYLFNGKPNSIPLPVFPDEPSIQKVYLELEMPKEWVLISTNRRWNEEFGWQMEGWQFVPENLLSGQTIQNWVADGTSTKRAVNSSGTMRGTEQSFLFSSVRPGKEQDQSFEIRAIDNRWLAAMVLLGFIVLTILMLRSTWKSRIIVAALVVSVLMALGLFAPLLSRQLLNYPASIGAAIAALFWSGQSLASLGSLARRSNLVSTSRLSENETVNGATTTTNTSGQSEGPADSKTDSSADDKTSEGAN
ncbi:MAG: hypothetical protein U0930_23355, partial [Pirellulales bacterium]